MGVLTDRLTEMAARHAASTEAACHELDQLKTDFAEYQRKTAQLLEDLGPCDE